MIWGCVRTSVQQDAEIYMPEGGLVRPKHVAIECDFNGILK
jgi:hypothetical protein